MTLGRNWVGQRIDDCGESVLVPGGIRYSLWPLPCIHRLPVVFAIGVSNAVAVAAEVRWLDQWIGCAIKLTTRAQPMRELVLP